MTQGEFTSVAENRLRMLSKDSNIGRRTILSAGRSMAKKIITQRVQERALFRQLDLFVEIECIEFEPESIVTCKFIEFKSCKKLMVSKKTLPELFSTRYGLSIGELYSIERQKTFNQSTLYQYRLDSQREARYEQDEFFILGNRIYLPDSDVRVLSGNFLTPDRYDADQLSECTDGCKSAWEYEFVCPDMFLEDVISYTVQNLLQTKSIQPDEKADQNENSK